MSVLKDWFHGITPSERKQIDAEKEQEYQKWLRDSTKEKQNKELQIREKIYNSPVTNKIVNDLVDLFSQEKWPSLCLEYSHLQNERFIPVMDALWATCIHVNTHSIEVEAPKPDSFITTVYRFNFQQNGYTDLSGDLERKYLIEFITAKIKAVLPDSYYFEYYATMGNDSIYWKNSRPDSPRCDRIRIRQKGPKPTSTLPLKSW